MGSVYVARDAKTNEIVSLLSSAKAFYGLAKLHEGEKFRVAKYKLDAPSIGLGGFHFNFCDNDPYRGQKLFVLENAKENSISGIFSNEAALAACLAGNPAHFSFDTRGMQAAFSLYESPEMLVRMVLFETVEHRFSPSIFNDYLEKGDFHVETYQADFDCILKKYVVKENY